MSEYFTSPVGRIVQGSVHTPQTTDQEGKPLVFKNGANAGQPRTEYFFALAVEKTNPDWPAFWAQLARVAQAAFPGGEYNAPNFSWKVVDGDGIDQNGKSNASKEGFAGHFVVKFKSSYPMQAVNNGNVIDPKIIRCGDYVRVFGTVQGNGGGSGSGPRKPGLYLNPNGIEFFGHGQEIVAGPDIREAAAAAPRPAYVPAGASATPVAPAGGPPALGAPMGGPPAVGAPVGGPPAVGGAPVATPGPGTAGHAFAFPGSAPTPSGAPPLPQAAPPPPQAAAAPAACPRGAPTGYRMTPKGSWTFQQLQAHNYTLESMLTAGYVERV